jgi:hypothetical protein
LRQASAFCGSDDALGKSGSTGDVAGTGLTYLRREEFGGGPGGSGNTSGAIRLESVVPGGALSQTRLTSMRLGMITVPSSLRAQPPAASSAGQRTKDNIRPNISNTPVRFIPGGGWLANGRITAGDVGPASEQERPRHGLRPVANRYG